MSGNYQLEDMECQKVMDMIDTPANHSLNFPRHCDDKTNLNMWRR